MPQAYVHTHGGSGPWSFRYVDVDFMKYRLWACFKTNWCFHKLVIDDRNIYVPNAKLYPRTFGTIKFKMKGRSSKSFDFNLRGISDLKVYTIKKMDLIIKSREIKLNRIPYCLIDSDFGFNTPYKTLYAAPCTSVSSIGDGREHFIHKYSLALYTRDKYRLVQY